MNKRVTEIYNITTKEIQNGVDYLDYIPIMYGLKIEEDYEAMQGIKQAIEDQTGITLIVPQNEQELDEAIEYIESKRIK